MVSQLGEHLEFRGQLPSPLLLGAHPCQTLSALTSGAHRPTPGGPRPVTQVAQLAWAYLPGELNLFLGSLPQPQRPEESRR